MKRYDGRLVHLVGGSAGIGLAAAKLFAARGADVLLLARGAERLAAAAEEVSAVRASAGQRVAWRALDVARHEEVRETLGRAVRELGPPAVLVNCAGRAIPRRFEEVSVAQLDETMRINFYGTWNTIAALLPVMRERGGHIVNVSSLAGVVGIFGYTDYAASKFAVIGFSEALRSELKPHGIRVSVLCPPDTDTPGLAAENRTKPEETAAISAGAKLMQPEEVARALLRGMERDRFLIIPGFEGKLARVVHCVAPWLVRRIVDRTVRKVQQKRVATGRPA